MRVRILGTGGGCPGPGRFGPGFLIETSRDRILLDCGSGIAGQLLAVCDLDDLDAIVLTHLHADHIVDVVTIAYGLLNRAQAADAKPSKQIPLYIPRGEAAALRAISAAFGHPSWKLRDVLGASPAYQQLVEETARIGDPLFALLPPTEYDPDGEFTIGDCRFVTRSMRHGPTTAALRITSEDVTFVYSGDTSPTPALAEIAANADLFLCEAMASPIGPRFYDSHITPGEAGAVAQQAGIRRLILTHLSPFANEAHVLHDAQRSFAGSVSLAREGDIFELGAATA